MPEVAYKPQQLTHRPRLFNLSAQTSLKQPALHRSLHVPEDAYKPQQLTHRPRLFNLSAQTSLKQPALASLTACARGCLQTAAAHTQAPFVQRVRTQIPEAASHWHRSLHCILTKVCLQTAEAHTQSPFVHLVRHRAAWLASVIAHCIGKRAGWLADALKFKGILRRGHT